MSEEIPGIESFLLLVMGLGPRFCVFSSSGSPLCVLHLIFIVIFCLDFGPFYFLLLFPCHMFFLSFFLSLINFEKTNREMKCTN